MDLRRYAFITLVPIVLACSGCSTVTFGYNHGDWLLRYWINGYTSFNEQQREEIHRDVDDYMRWHREHALPEYITFLQQVDALVGGNVVTAADVMRTKAKLNRLYRLTMTPLVQPAAHVLSTLDRRQIERLRDTLTERNREFREETLSGTDREKLTARAENHIRIVERLVGSLSSEQEEKITQMSTHIPFVTGRYIEEREARQASLIALLDAGAGEDRIAALFRDWIATPGSAASAQEQRAGVAYEDAMNDMIAGIFGLLTDHQKEHLRERISVYIKDLQRLHTAGGTDNAASGAQVTH